MLRAPLGASAHRHVRALPRNPINHPGTRVNAPPADAASKSLVLGGLAGVSEFGVDAGQDRGGMSCSRVRRTMSVSTSR